jgi:hypothetical protein
MSGEFKKLAKQIKTAMLKGAVSAVNKSLAYTRDQMTKSLSDQTGLKKKAVNDRTNLIKATVKDPRGSLSVVFTRTINLAEFSPRQGSLTRPSNQGPLKRKKSQRKYDTVSVSLGGFTNVLVPGGFLRTMPNGKVLVVARKNSLNSDGSYTNRNNVTGRDARTLVGVQTSVLADVAKNNHSDYIAAAQGAFDDIKDSEIDFAIAQATSGANISDT